MRSAAELECSGPGGGSDRTETDVATTIADEIFAEVRQEIVEGRIPQGSKISEPELARRYGISRGPLREAIGRLESAGLVSRRANVGARVITLSSDQLLEIYHVREALEGMAARLAAKHMSESEVEALQDLVAKHRCQVGLEQGQAHFRREADLDFHYRIVSGSHNNRLIALMCNDLYHLVRMYRCQFGRTRPRASEAQREHDQIADAIAGRDGELAEILMRRHIRTSRAYVESRLLGESPTPGKSTH